MELTPSAALFDRAAPTYDRVGVDFFEVFGRRLVGLPQLSPGQSVLDIGTGRGALLTPAAAAVGHTGRAIGVDLAPTMVALTAAEQADHDHVDVCQGDAAALPADLGTFDAVLSSLMLFFTDDPAATLQHWADHVADGGCLGLVTFLEDLDDRWFRDLLMQFLPERDAPEPPDGPSSFELVGDATWLDAQLSAVGLGAIETTTLRHPVRFTDIQQWWAWVWSHGGRAGVELLAPEDHGAVKAAAAESLDARRLDDGSLGLHVTVRFTLGRRP